MDLERLARSTRKPSRSMAASVRAEGEKATNSCRTSKLARCCDRAQVGLSHTESHTTHQPGTVVRHTNRYRRQTGRQAGEDALDALADYFFLLLASFGFFFPYPTVGRPSPPVRRPFPDEPVVKISGSHCGAERRSRTGLSISKDKTLHQEGNISSLTSGSFQLPNPAPLPSNCALTARSSSLSSFHLLPSSRFNPRWNSF